MPLVKHKRRPDNTQWSAYPCHSALTITIAFQTVTTLLSSIVYPFPKFHENSPVTFCAVLTDKQPSKKQYIQQAVVKVTVINCMWFALTLLVGHYEERPACKNWVMNCWHGYLSEVRCKWFAYRTADATATATPSYLASLKPGMLNPQCKEVQWFNCRPLPLKPVA